MSLVLWNKMSVQTRSTRVKAPAILDPGYVPVEALSTNEKATLNLSERVDCLKEMFFVIVLQNTHSSSRAMNLIKP